MPNINPVLGDDTLYLSPVQPLSTLYHHRRNQFTALLKCHVKHEITVTSVPLKLMRAYTVRIHPGKLFYEQHCVKYSGSI